MIADNKVTETAAESPGYRHQTPGITAQCASIHAPLHFSPRHLGAARSCSRVIANPAQKWGCRKNTLFLAWIFCGVGFNSATDKTPLVKTLVFQTPHAPCLKPSRFCYIMRPPVCTMAPSVRLCPKLDFSDKKGKKTALSGIEPPTTVTADARDATTASGSVFFTSAALPHPALALLLLL